MKIAVASGKGGTGKTTIALNLTLSVAPFVEKIQLADCDVEEPNVHIFLKPEINKKIPVTTLIPQWDRSLCNFCEKCNEVCSYNAFSLLKIKENGRITGEFIFFPHLCHGCSGCILFCPEGALKEGERIIGEISLGQKENISFIEGKLNLMEVFSAKVIKEVKKLLNPEVDAIIDCPPGTTCATVEALKKVDFVLLVTEPTPFGLHDLKLIYQVIEKLKIPAGVLINKALEDGLIEKFCKEKHLPILTKIPFDKKIAEAYAKGENLLDFYPELKEKFLELYYKIKKIV